MTTLASCTHCGLTGTPAQTPWRHPILLHRVDGGAYVLVNGTALAATPTMAGDHDEHVCAPRPAQTTKRTAKRKAAKKR